MPRKIAKSLPGYYSPGDAMKRLGIADRDLFNSIIRKHESSGRLKPIKPAGVNMYPEQQIDEIADEIALMFLEEDEPTEVRPARPEDALGIYNVLSVGFGWQTAPIELRRAWYRVNSLIDHVIVAEGRIQGYITAVPYTKEALEEMMSGRKRAWDMQPEDILPYRYHTEEPYTLYVGAAVRKDAPRSKQLAARLLSGFMSFLREMATQGIVVRYLYAVSAESDGQRLCKDLGFVEQKAQVGDRFPRFVLDLQTSPSRFAKQYREALAKA